MLSIIFILVLYVGAREASGRGSPPAELASAIVQLWQTTNLGRVDTGTQKPQHCLIY